MVSLSLDAAAAQRRANTCGLGTLAKLAGRSKCWRNPLPGTIYIIAPVHIVCVTLVCAGTMSQQPLYHWLYASLPLSQVLK
jgi:hypothetical protein